MAQAKSDVLLFKKAVRAMRQAVRKVIVERKLKGHPLIIWRDGKVVKIPAKQL